MKTYRLLLLLAAIALVGCASTPPPAGQEGQRAYTQQSAMPYQEAYRIIAKQMRACYRSIGPFGNGYDIQADMDTAAKTASVELYPVGLTGAEKPEDSQFSRTVSIKASGTGSLIETTGQTPKWVYMNHRAVTGWLAGDSVCRP
jgi:hypothetical protein